MRLEFKVRMRVGAILKVGTKDTDWTMLMQRLGNMNVILQSL